VLTTNDAKAPGRTTDGVGSRQRKGDKTLRMGAELFSGGSGKEASHTDAKDFQPSEDTMRVQALADLSKKDAVVEAGALEFDPGPPKPNIGSIKIKLTPGPKKVRAKEDFQIWPKFKWKGKKCPPDKLKVTTKLGSISGIDYAQKIKFHGHNVTIGIYARAVVPKVQSHKKIKEPITFECEAFPGSYPISVDVEITVLPLKWPVWAWVLKEQEFPSCLLSGAVETWKLVFAHQAGHESLPFVGVENTGRADKKRRIVDEAEKDGAKFTHDKADTRGGERATGGYSPMQPGLKSKLAAKKTSADFLRDKKWKPLSRRGRVEWDSGETHLKIPEDNGQIIQDIKVKQKGKTYVLAVPVAVPSVEAGQTGSLTVCVLPDDEYNQYGPICQSVRVVAAMADCSKEENVVAVTPAPTPEEKAQELVPEGELKEPLENQKNNKAFLVLILFCLLATGGVYMLFQGDDDEAGAAEPSENASPEEVQPQEASQEADKATSEAASNMNESASPADVNTRISS
jgi:hypothetical protein